MLSIEEHFEYFLEPLQPFGIRLRGTGESQLADLSPATLQSLVLKHKFVLLRGFSSASPEEFLQYCQSFPARNVLSWDAGPIMEMTPHKNPNNYLFSNEAVPFHWDGAFHRVPTFLFFHCLEAPNESAGGETLLSNTASIWESASPKEAEEWYRISLSYFTEKKAHYGGSITLPMVQRHPVTNAIILRFAEAVDTSLNPVALSVHGIPKRKHAEFLTSMRDKIYSPQFCYQHHWEKGDYLIADNHALIHGRKAFSNQSKRHLRRIQIT